MLVALSVKPDYKFVINKGITDGDNKKVIKKSIEKEIKVDGHLFQGGSRQPVCMDRNELDNF